MRCRLHSRHFLCLLIVQCCLFVIFTNAQAAEGALSNKITVAGPPAGVSNALIHMANPDNDLALPWTVEFKIWTTPDQLRALALEGNIDFIALPTNVAANLYNKGVDLKLLNISQWGALWIVSRHPDKQSLKDFKHERLAVPFRADMPDIVLTHLLHKEGLDSRNDLELHYTATPIEAMQLLITRRVDHALLAEPAVSMALRKTHSFPLSAISPELHRSIDLQERWGQLMHTAARIPQAGIAVFQPNDKDPLLIESFLNQYEAANQWCYEHPQKCAAEVSTAISMLAEQAVEDAIRHQNPYYARIELARTELQDFFEVLYENNAASLGNALPPQEFYEGIASRP